MSVIDDKFKLGTTCIKNQLYAEAFDHFKESVHINANSAIDILIFLYQQLIQDYQSKHIRAMIAEIYVLISDYKEAVQELKELFEMDPHYSKTYQILGKIYNKAGQKLSIRHIFESAIDQQIFDSAIINVLPKIYLEDRNIDKNIRFFQNLVIHMPSQNNYYKILSELYLRNRDYENATEILNDLLEKSPSTASELIEPLTQLIAQVPRNAKAHMILIKALFHSTKPIEATAQIRELIAINESLNGDLIILLKKNIDYYPNNSDILFILTELLISANDYSEATHSLKTIFEHDPQHNETIIGLLDTILKECPEQCMAIGLLFDIYYSQNNFEQALHYLDAMINLEPENIPNIQDKLQHILETKPHYKHQARLLLTKIYFLSERYQEALEFSQELRHTPLYLEAGLLESKIHHFFKNYNDSYTLLQELYKKAPYHCDLHHSLQESYSSLCRHHIETLQSNDTTDQLELALYYLTDNDTTNAIETLQKITSTHSQYMEAQVLLGRAFMESGKFELSLNTLETLLSETNTKKTELSNTIRYFIAINLSLIGKHAHATHYIDQILSKSVNYSGALAFREQLQDKTSLDLRGLGISGCLGLPFHAAPTLSFIVDNPENDMNFKKQKAFQTISFAHSHNNDGVTHLLQGHYKAAEQAFKLALQMDPKLTIAYCNLAYLYISLASFKNAQQHIDSGLEHSPKNDLLHLHQGLLCILEKDYEKGLESLQKSYKLNPKNKLTPLYIGDLHYMMNNIKAAFDYWTQVSDSHNLAFLVEQRRRYLKPPSIDICYWTQSPKEET